MIAIPVLRYGNFASGYPKRRMAVKLSLMIEQFPFVCSGLGAMPTAAVGMFFLEKKLHGRAV
jgi:hypothetical protein